MFNWASFKEIKNINNFMFLIVLIEAPGRRSVQKSLVCVAYKNFSNEAYFSIGFFNLYV